MVKKERQNDMTYFTMIRSSFSLKIIPIFIAGLLTGHPYGVIFGYFLLYFLTQYRRYYGVWRFAGCRKRVFVLLPLVKLTMDLATDWGRISELCNRKNSWNHDEATSKFSKLI